MDEVFLLNEKLKDELVLICKAKYVHTTFYPDGLNGIPLIVDVIGQELVDDVPYYESCAVWPIDAQEEDLENALNCINFHSKKINKVAVMTSVIEEQYSNGIHFTWAIFLDKIDNNTPDLG